MKIITKEQIRAARGLLGWSQTELAGRVGVSRDLISKVEMGTTSGSKTISAIYDTFERTGIVFKKDDGVSRPKALTTFIDGDDWFLKLLDDVLFTLKDSPDPELLVDMSDDHKSPPEVVAKYRILRKAGIQMRQTVEQGNTFLMGPNCEYRWIPKEFYKNWVTLIYDNKIAYKIAGQAKCNLVVDAERAEIERNKFNLAWTMLPEITEGSTANAFF